jgi:hypothetical protein
LFNIAESSVKLLPATRPFPTFARAAKEMMISLGELVVTGAPATLEVAGGELITLV